MQGIFLGLERPKSKKAIREAVAADPANVYVEATSMFGNEYGGSVAGMPDGVVLFVGPDPYTKRSFYGKIMKMGDNIKVM